MNIKELYQTSVRALVKPALAGVGALILTATGCATTGVKINQENYHRDNGSLLYNAHACTPGACTKENVGLIVNSVSKRFNENLEKIAAEEGKKVSAKGSLQWDADLPFDNPCCGTVATYGKLKEK